MFGYILLQQAKQAVDWAMMNRKC